MEPLDLHAWEGFSQACSSKIHSERAIVDQIVIDSRRIESKNSLFVALEGKQSDGHAFVKQAEENGAKFALVRKNWDSPENLSSITLLRVDDPLLALQQIACVHRKRLKAFVLAITGSFGKTLLKDLLSTLLQSSKRTSASPESFNSQIGAALSLLRISLKDEIALIEAGISQPDEMNHLAHMILPDAAIITNIGDAHLSTLSTIESTASEKAKLITIPPLLKWSLLPKHPNLEHIVREVKQPIHYWSENLPSLPFAQASNPIFEKKMRYTVVFPDGHLYQGEITAGFHYVLDLINIAIKAAWLLETPSEVISKGLKEYELETMSTEIWKSPQGATFINDAYCSDYQSVEKALKHFNHTSKHQRKIFLFGGMRGKHNERDYQCIGEAITRHGIDHLMLFDQQNFTPLIDEVLKSSANTDITLTQTYEEALSKLTKINQDDVILIKGPKKFPLEILLNEFNDSICNNQCTIQLSKVKENISIIKAKHPGVRLMVLVKALAYGTDDIRMAKHLTECGIDILGVSYVDEAISLRKAGVKQDIFVINAAIYEAAKVLKWGLEIGVSDKQMIQTLNNEAEKQGKLIKVHLHVDTGMSRFGCRPEEALELALLIKSYANLHLEGLMTHFACADNPGQDDFTHKQVKAFEEVIHTLIAHNVHVKWHHASNTGALMRFNFHQFNMARIGLGIYGLSPSEAAQKATKLQLAVSLTSRIVGINKCRKGETISYGRSYTIEKNEQRIAVLPIGYFDGLHRNYSGKGKVIIRGKEAPMVGNICMDYMMVDVTDIPDAEPGDSVLIFGKDEYGHFLSPENLAENGSSIVYELITCLGPRIQRIFISE